ncbi:Insecticial toxin [Oxalobacteraceae bacterium CAVE-383]|nr:Insecticial toxin [Oxalobacteraceae bacterium CAVE-383]
MPAIAAACEKAHCIISFRDAGEATLEKLAFGAPAKGHDILEKTIKDGSIRKNYPSAQADTILAALKKAGLLGYVGHWDKQTGALLGIYMGPAHSLDDRVSDGIYKIDITMIDDGDSYRIDMDKFNASLAPLTAQENWRALPFTGDYDLHDMISLIGQRSTVPSNSREEKRIINAVNEKIAAADPHRRGKSVKYNTVRHGPQVSYVAFALERKETIVPSVAAADFPLAFVHKGEWTIVRNAEEHLAYYRKIKMNMKASWLPQIQTTPFRRSGY